MKLVQKQIQGLVLMKIAQRYKLGAFTLSGMVVETQLSERDDEIAIFDCKKWMVETQAFSSAF